MDVPSGNSGNLDRSVGRSAFGGDAAGYHDSRSGYPDKLFDCLSVRLAGNPRILEIGAGTGLATQGLLTCAPGRLALVEPDPRLCEFLRGRFPADGVDVVCGTFPDAAVSGPFDLVACAAAFHWMEPVAALKRIRELLAPGGSLAIWWNCYFGHGEPDPFGDRVSQVLAAHDVALPPSYQGRRHYALDAGLHSAQLEAGGFHDVTHRVFREQRPLDAPQARALYQTFSFISQLPEATRESIFDEITGLIERDFAGRAQSLVVTSLYTASL